MSLIDNEQDKFMGLPFEMWKTIIIPLVLLFLGWIGKVLHDFIKIFVRGKYEEDNSDTKSTFYLNTDNNNKQLDDFNTLNVSDVNKLINNNLLKLWEKINAKGAWLGRFHDNSTIFTSYPNHEKWLVFSITNISNKSDSTKSKKILNHIPLILLKPILDSIYNKGYFFTDDISTLPASLYYIFKRLKLYSFCAVGVFNSNEELIAILGIEKRKKLEITKQLIEEINTTGQNVSNLLQLVKKII